MNARFLFFALCFSVVFLFSCKDDNDDPQVQNDYLVEFELLRTIPMQEATTVLGALPGTDAIVGAIETSANLYKIVYKTTFRDQKINASALVAIPNNSESNPVVSFQNGTNPEHAEAPTVNPSNVLYRALMNTSTTGFVVALPDYIGYGETSNVTPHPYFHKETSTQSVMDMLSAIKELPQNIETEAEISDKLFLAGYSQGAWATLAIHNHIESLTTTDIELEATACGAGPYNILGIALSLKALPSYSQPYFLGFMATAYKSLDLFPNPLSDMFKAPYAERLPSLFDGSRSGEEINAQLSTDMTALLTDNFRAAAHDDPTFAPVFLALNNNSVAPWAAESPINFYHGTGDIAIPFQSSQQMALAMTQAGTDASLVNYTPIPNLGHTEAIIPSIAAAFTWFISLK